MEPPKFKWGDLGGAPHPPAFPLVDVLPYEKVSVDRNIATRTQTQSKAGRGTKAGRETKENNRAS